MGDGKRGRPPRPRHDDPQPDRSAGVAAIGQLFASFAGAVLVLAVDLGVPIADSVKADILAFLVTTWAFASAIYVVARSNRLLRTAQARRAPPGARPRSAVKGGEPPHGR